MSIELCVNQYVQAEKKGDILGAIDFCEKLAFEYDLFDYKVELVRLYNTMKYYEKTVSTVALLMNDKELKDDDISPQEVLTIKAPDVIMREAIAFKELGKFDAALECCEYLIKTQRVMIANHPNASSTESRKFVYGVCCSIAGEIYYNEKGDYQKAIDYFNDGSDISPTVCSTYFLAFVNSHAICVEKNLEFATTLFEFLADTNINEADESDEKYIINSNYELGMIYATEEGYLDKNKALQRLRKAKAMGYNITDEKIDLICSKIEEVQKVETEKKTSEDTQNSDGCYIATCVYGSYDCSPVWVLRRFRDKVLKNTILGKAFIKVYYFIGPIIVDKLGNYELFNMVNKFILDKIVKKLKQFGVKDTPYNDK